MINYIGKDLYDKIEKVVNKAFRDTFIESEDTYCFIDEISLDYSTVESTYDLPFINVEIGVVYKNNTESLTTNYFLDKSEEYNIGYISCEFWKKFFE